MLRMLAAAKPKGEIEAGLHDLQTAADILEVLLRAEIDMQCIALTSAAACRVEAAIAGIDLNGLDLKALARSVITAAVGRAKDPRSACETTA
jgi:hypothetical protein